MQLIYDILPVILFFLAFKFYGIYVATVVGIAATAIQTIVTRMVLKHWDKKQLITLLVFVLFGGMTLYFHDPIFVKWKPTIVFWVFALSIMVTHFFTERPLMQRLMESMLEGKGALPILVWRRINLMWAAFFSLLGGVNLYIAYTYSNEAWVNFKLFGITGALFLFSIIQAIYLSSYLTDTKSTHE